MSRIGSFLIALVICYPIAFGVSAGIVEAWVAFWTYGDIYNSVTLPAFYPWYIFLDNILIIAIIACFISPFMIWFLYMYLED